MGSPSESVRLWFASAIAAVVEKKYPGSGIDNAQVLNSISVPKKEFGDLSSSIAIRLSKIAKKSPREIASEISTALERTDLVKEVLEAGGYVNLMLDEQKYSKIVFDAVNTAGKKYGANHEGNGRTVLIEFPAVNPNKPWHIGHLRNALLGDSISRILDFCSYNVEREDYIDDLGLQIAEIVWGSRNLPQEPVNKKFDQWLGEQYVKVNRMMEERNAKAEISEVLKRMEEPGTLEAVAARDMSMKCVRAQYETAAAYGIYHDVMVWESDIVHAKLLDKALKIGIDSGALERPAQGKNAGCLVMNLDKAREFGKAFENPNEHEKVIVRSDGTATYVAKDMAFHMWKLGILDADFRYANLGMQANGVALYSTASKGEEMDFGRADIVVNIIGSAQKYPQLILKAMLSLAGYPKKAASIVHVAYGEVSVDSGSLSGRSGGWMGEEKAYTADVLLEEAQKKALEATEKSKKIDDSSKISSISQEIGKAAIKFEYLRVSPEKPVVFSWSSALNFEGNSGPYCMYSYARAGRILKKGGYSGMAKRQDSDLIYKSATRGQDFELVKLIGGAGEVVKKAAAGYTTSVIADYVIDLTSTFSRFYESMHVLGDESKEYRMELVHIYMTTLSNMLALLGIGTVDEM